MLRQSSLVRQSTLNGDKENVVWISLLLPALVAQLHLELECLNSSQAPLWSLSLLELVVFKYVQQAEQVLLVFDNQVQSRMVVSHKGEALPTVEHVLLTLKAKRVKLESDLRPRESLRTLEHVQRVHLSQIDLRLVRVIC